VANNILQSVKQLTTFSRIQGGDDDKNIVDLRVAMGVMQHHEAITGTEKQMVATDYNSMLYLAIEKTQDSMSKIIR
jgi:lysosomal alpha-mannosidase